MIAINTCIYVNATNSLQDKDRETPLLRDEKLHSAQQQKVDDGEVSEDIPNLDDDFNN